MTSSARLQIGHYEVLGALARGKTAEVFRVRDEDTGEHHALKMLVDLGARAAFEREVEALNRLNHPCVVRSYLYGEHDGRPWYSMELLHGEVGTRFAKHLGRPGEDARTKGLIRVISPLARGLHAVHRQGVVHLDVKPSNIMILPDERVKLLDFGEAWLGSGEPSAGGNPAYLAPELVQRSPIDHRVDLYALGVLMFRLLTGRMPVKGTTPEETLRLQVEQEAPDPRTFVPELDAGLAGTILACLAKDPARRPASAARLADHLEGIYGRTLLPGNELAVHERVLFEDHRLDAHETALAVGRVVGRRAPAGDLARRFHEVTEGRPEAVVEVAQKLVEDGTVQADGERVQWSRFPIHLEVASSVHRGIRQQLARCSKGERLVASLVMLAPGIAPEVLSTKLKGRVDKVVRGLVSKDLVRVHDGGLCAFSPAVVGVLDELLDDGKRAGMEKVLLRGGAEDLPVCSLKVRVLIAAGQETEVVEELVRHLEALAAQERWDAAFELIQDVWTELTELGPVGPVGQAMLWFARSGSVTHRAKPKATMQALALAREAADTPDAEARVTLTEAELQLTVGHYKNHHDRIARVTGRDDLQDPELVGAAAVARARSALWGARIREAERALEQLPEEGLSDALQAFAQTLRGRCAYELGQLRESEELAVTARERVPAASPVRGRALHLLADTLRRQGRFTEALEPLRAAVGPLRTASDPIGYTHVVLGMGWCELDLNRLGRAQECVEELSSVIRQREHLHLRLERDLLSAAVHVASGRPEEALYPLQQVSRFARAAGLQRIDVDARQLHLEAELRAGLSREGTAAWFESRRIGLLADKRVWPYAEAARLHATRGGPGVDPAGLFEPLLRALDGEPAHIERIRLWLTRAEVAAARGQVDEAMRAAGEAADRFAVVSEKLDVSERFAFRVHPWKAALDRSVAEARRASTNPAARR